MSSSFSQSNSDSVVLVHDLHQSKSLKACSICGDGSLYIPHLTLAGSEVKGLFVPHGALQACVIQHAISRGTHQSRSSLSSYRKGMAWKTWKAIMPRLLGKRANTKACRPLLPLQYTMSLSGQQQCCSISPSYSEF